MESQSPPNSASESAPAPNIAIAGITEPTLLKYFDTFNQGDFEATARLFADRGALHPPFESPIVGTNKIATFLETEAEGMKLTPREGIIEAIEAVQTKFQIGGTVQTALFGVNVAWYFTLNQQQEILYVRVKLLASPQELLNLQRQNREAIGDREVY